MASKTLATIVIIFSCMLFFPIILGVFGGIFGLVMGIFGAVFGIIAGIFGVFGGIFAALFHSSFLVIAIIIVFVALISKSNSKKDHRK